jgi:dTDP-4-dehydrorhamnose 3,5-epimerase
MEIIDTAIEAVKIMRPKRFGDERGFFSEVFRRDVMEQAGLPTDWVQDNHSRSSASGTVRGLHFQARPFAQDKLIRVVRGRILDAAVDLRRSSRTFGHHVVIELSAENWQQLLVPIGFAHGFCTLEPDTEVLYKVTAPYSGQHDLGLAWNDPDLGIAWPVSPDAAILSDKDRQQPRLADLSPYFD